MLTHIMSRTLTNYLKNKRYYWTFSTSWQRWVQYYFPFRSFLFSLQEFKREGHAGKLREIYTRPRYIYHVQYTPYGVNAIVLDIPRPGRFEPADRVPCEYTTLGGECTLPDARSRYRLPSPNQFLGRPKEIENKTK